MGYVVSAFLSSLARVPVRWLRQRPEGAAIQNIPQAVGWCSSWCLVPLCPLERPMLQDTLSFAEVMETLEIRMTRR